MYRVEKGAMNQPLYIVTISRHVGNKEKLKLWSLTLRRLPARCRDRSICAKQSHGTWFCMTKSKRIGH